MSEFNPALEEALFEAAVAKPSPAERASFLEAVCRDNPALHARLDVLLEGHFQAEGFLGGEPKNAEQKPAPAQGEDGSTFIGRYKLLEKLGEGGFGEVWMAAQNEPVKRRVALKIIKLGMDTKQVVARFEAERQALALMDHPNIAKVFDAGATDIGRPYFVMELVRGERITEFCDKNQVTAPERLNLFIQVCRAIQHAHQKGIIHRDIKPSNILVTLHDGVPVPKIIDFGIAKATRQELTEKTVFTQFRQFLGTPAYISPEQAEMSGLDIDTRSDIYSLGVLLYELLTGLTPFDTQELLKAGLEELRKAIRDNQPLRPSTRLSGMAKEALTTAAKRRGAEPPKLISLVRGDLDWIVMKCLEKDRARRYETANGLARDVERFLHHEPIVARPPSVLYEFQKSVRRHWMGFAVVAAVVGALGIGMVLSTIESVRARRAEAVSRERLAESEAISAFLTEVFQSPDPERDGRTITVAESLGAAARRLDSALSGQPARQAQLQNVLGLTYYGLGLDSEAIACLEKARDYFLAAAGPQNPNTLRVLHGLANSYDRAGRLEQALKLREQVLAIRRKMSGPEHPETLSAALSLAISYCKAGRSDEAINLMQQLVPIYRRVNGPEHPATLNVMNNLAACCLTANDLEKARNTLEQVLPIYRRVRGPEHPNTLWAMHNLSACYERLGRLNEAFKLNEQVLELAPKVWGPEHPETISAMYGLSCLYVKAGRTGDALKLRQQVLALRRKFNGQEHPDTQRVIQALAESYCTVGRSQDAAALLAQDIPRRGTNVPINLIDLTAYYNAPLTISWHSNPEDNNDLTSLPRGMTTLSNIDFDVRGLIQLGLADPGGLSYPAKVEGIHIGRVCQRLHFLHAAAKAASARLGDKLGSYIIHYRDGQSLEIPIVTGRDLADWWSQPNEEGMKVTIAWIGNTAEARQSGHRIRLFMTTWENPLPTVGIDEFDFVSSNPSRGAPFLVAVTAEP